MTKKGRFLLSSALSVLLAAFVFYCVRFGIGHETIAGENAASSAQDALQTALLLSGEAETAWKSNRVNHITLSDSESNTSAPGVQIYDNTVRIVTPGIYGISGHLNDGSLIVDASGDVVLILDGVDISNPSDAAICLSDADHTLIYLPEGSRNMLASGTEAAITSSAEDSDEESTSGAALYARDDLSIAGSGGLSVYGYINNAVATTDHLTVLSGCLEIEAVNNGLKGKDSVTVLGGVIHIQSGNDGIKSNNDTQASGIVDIRGGEIEITSFGDGIYAENEMSIADGVILITAGLSSQAASIRPESSLSETPPDMQEENFSNRFGPAISEGQPDQMQPGREMPFELPQSNVPVFNGEEPSQSKSQRDRGRRASDSFNDRSGNERGNAQGEFGGIFDREGRYDDDLESGVKGLKSGCDLNVSGGSITVNSFGDCLHANGSITVCGGTLLLSTADDGMHADKTLTVSGGSITVSQAYEGIEALSVYITGGNISVTASDDGINAGGGSDASAGRMFVRTSVQSSSLPILRISGGTILVNADGDGLDSNGDLIVEGGHIVVDGPTNSGNGALDSGFENGGRLLSNGGTILAIGASGMAESFESSSEQPSFIKKFSTSFPAGTVIQISDASGAVIMEHTSAKSFNSVVFSSGDLVRGNTYSITVGSQTETVAV